MLTRIGEGCGDKEERREGQFANVWHLIDPDEALLGDPKGAQWLLQLRCQLRNQ